MMGLHGKLGITALTCPCEGGRRVHAPRRGFRTCLQCDFRSPLPSASLFTPLPAVTGWLLQLMLSLVCLSVFPSLSVPRSSFLKPRGCSTTLFEGTASSRRGRRCQQWYRCCVGPALDWLSSAIAWQLHEQCQQPGSRGRAQHGGGMFPKVSCFRSSAANPASFPWISCLAARGECCSRALWFRWSLGMWGLMLWSFPPQLFSPLHCYVFSCRSF